jgi:hypothetical protein
MMTLYQIGFGIQNNQQERLQFMLRRGVAASPQAYSEYKLLNPQRLQVREFL